MSENSVDNNKLFSLLLRIESRLAEVLPEKASAGWIENACGIKSTEKQTDWADSFLLPGTDLLGRGGKRWRPLSTVLICEALGGGDSADVLTPLVEIPHNGTLIIDDIEDNSLLRRGEPAAHVKYGVDVSVNMGNLMYFLPTMILDKPEVKNIFNTETRLDILSDFNRAMRKVHFGQGFDILWHREKHIFPDKDSYLAMCSLKTGSLAALGAELGVRAAFSANESSGEPGGGKAAETEYSASGKKSESAYNNIFSSLSSAMEKLGTGFQILDDVQNLSSGIPGKSRGDDIVEGKKSLPVIIHVQKNKSDAQVLSELFEKAASEQSIGIRDSVERTIELLEKSGSIHEAKIQGDTLINEGKTVLEEVLPDGSAKTELISLFDGFIKKMK